MYKEFFLDPESYRTIKNMDKNALDNFIHI